MKNAPFFVAQKTGMKLALYISIIKKLGVNILVGLLVVNTWKIQQRADKKY